MSFQKGHSGFRTKESYRKAGLKIANNPNSKKTQFKKGIIPWSKTHKGIHLSPDTEFKIGQTSGKKTLIGKVGYQNRKIILLLLKDKGG